MRRSGIGIADPCTPRRRCRPRSTVLTAGASRKRCHLLTGHPGVAGDVPAPSWRLSERWHGWNNGRCDAPFRQHRARVTRGTASHDPGSFAGSTNRPIPAARWRSWRLVAMPATTRARRLKASIRATVLCPFPEMRSQRRGADTVLTGLLDRSALFGVLAEIEALGLGLVEVRLLESPRGRPGKSPA